MPNDNKYGIFYTDKLSNIQKLEPEKIRSINTDVLNKANNCNFAHVPYTTDFKRFLRLFSEQKQKAENAMLPIGESTLSNCIYPDELDLVIDYLK